MSPDVQTFASGLKEGNFDAPAGTGASTPWATSPQAAADHAQLVVTVTLEAVRPGPAWPNVFDSVIEANVTDVHKGQLPAGANDKIYVDRWTVVPPDRLDALLPKGTRREPAVLGHAVGLPARQARLAGHQQRPPGQRQRRRALFVVGSPEPSSS